MRIQSLVFSVVASLLPLSFARAQAIIAQTQGLWNPQYVVDFGTGLFPNSMVITSQFPGITLTHCAYYTTGTFNNVQGGFLTNDHNAGMPNTLTIHFASPIHDVSFVYHQVSPAMASNFRALLGTVVVDSFSHVGNQTQPNNYYGFTNVVFDELQIDFVFDFSLDTLAFSGGSPPPVVFCTAGTTTGGCTARMSASQNPSVSFANPCSVTVSGLEGAKAGLLFYGLNNPTFMPHAWAAGSTSWLCVSSPSQRTSVLDSGGTPNSCNGAYAIDWNAFQSTHPQALGNPWIAGAQVDVQAWFRDPPAPKSTSLSDAVRLTYVP
jgi:hypothetical protein